MVRPRRHGRHRRRGVRGLNSRVRVTLEGLLNGDLLTHGHLVVLADDAGHRAVPIWLHGGTDPGTDDLARLVELRDRPPEEVVSAAVPEEPTTRLLEVAGLGLAIAVTARAPIRVTDAVMSRSGVPVAGDDLLTPFLDRVPAAGRERSVPGQRPRYEPRNLDFANGLDQWNLEAPDGYAAGVDGQSATLSAAASRPAGSARLLQAIYAEDYRGQAVIFSGDIRTSPGTEQAGLRLLVVRHSEGGEPVREDRVVAVSGPAEWTRREVTALIPGDANMIVFGVELTGPGLVALRNPELRPS